MADDDWLRLDNQLCFSLYAASRAVVQAYQPLLEPLGLTYPQYLVMLVLWETDGASVGQLGERLQLDSGTLTPLLKRLEGQGLVSRQRSTRDERVVEIFLTTRGKRLRSRATEIPRTLACKMGMTAEEFGKIQGELRALVERLRQAD